VEQGLQRKQKRRDTATQWQKIRGFSNLQGTSHQDYAVKLAQCSNLPDEYNDIDAIFKLPAAEIEMKQVKQ
jgi:hypothetical protein